MSSALEMVAALITACVLGLIIFAGIAAVFAGLGLAALAVVGVITGVL